MRRNYLIVFILLSTFVSINSQPAYNLNLKKSTVDVPWHEFKSVIEKLTQTVPPPLIDSVYPPVDYCLKSIEVNGLVVNRKTARFSTTVNVNISKSKKLQKDGWIAVPIGDDLSSNVNHAVLEGAFLNGKTVPIHNKNGKNEVLFSNSGDYKLILKYFCPIKNYEGNWEIRLGLPRAASGKLDFKIPGARANVYLNGIKQNPNINKNGTVLSTALSLDQQIIIKYSLMGDGMGDKFDALQMSPKVFATTSMLMTIKENRVRYQYKVDYQIWHQKLKTFKIGLPDSLPIENVSGAGLTEWKVKKGKDGNYLEASTSFAPERTYSLTVDFSKKLETVKAEIRVPVLKPLNVNRENGFLAVQASETMEIFTSDNIVNMVTVPASELPFWLQNQKEVLLRYKYNKTPFNLTLNVLRHKDMPVIVAIADEALFTGLITKDGYYLTKYRYFIRNNHKQYLSLKMPQKWILWSALIDGNAVLPASTDLNNEVLIPLKKMSQTEEGTGFILELVYWYEGEKYKRSGMIEFETPVIDINCQKIIGELWLPEKYEYKDFNGTLKDVDVYNSRYLSSTEIKSKRKEKYLPVQSNTFMIGKEGRVLSLPVEIEIPKKGKSIKFSKELTIAGEKGDVQFRYSKKLLFVKPLFKTVVWFLLFIISIFISKWLFGGISDKNKKIILIGLAMILALLMFSNLIINEILNMEISAPGFTVVLGIFLALLSHFGTLDKKEKRA